MRKLRILLAGVTLAALMTGCGVSPFLPQLNQGPEQGLRAKDAQAGAVVEAVRQTWSKTTSASGVVAFFEQKGRETTTSKAEFFWARPQKLRANITEADSVTKRGAKLVYLGDGRITAKLGFIKRTLPYDDPQVLSLRGYRIDQTSLTSIIDGLLDPAASVRHAGTVTIAGRPADLLELTKGSGVLPGCSKMQLAIDRQNRMPLQVEGFEGTAVVFRAQLSGMALNPKLSDDLFKL
jgi:outer membrane lipoprotein-sorting protein